MCCHIIQWKYLIAQCIKLSLTNILVSKRKGKIISLTHYSELWVYVCAKILLETKFISR